MKAQKWIIMLVCCLALLLGSLAIFNYEVDPYAVFGNKTWYSFSETLNPRVAKTSYLKEYSEFYDSYIVGCSGSSSLPKREFDEYLAADFYNTICYGADMKDSRQTVQWLIDNCKVKNIILNVYIDNALDYDTGANDINYKLHCDVSGENPIKFYASYLLANPKYSFDKLKDLKEDQVLQQSYDVFDEYSGAYDKSTRDVEYIGSLDDYLVKYPVFTNYPKGPQHLGYIKECVNEVSEIVRLCEENNINLIVINTPVYGDLFEGYDPDSLKAYYEGLAEVTDFWDCSYSSVSKEPRYYYDATHFRNDIGKMIAARIFDDESVYIPDDFGVYVTKDMVTSHISRLCEKSAEALGSQIETELAVLTYHDISDSESNSMTISTEGFESHLKALQGAGYHSVSLDEIYDYVYRGAGLPSKPVLITFDDGYLSNYELAYPLLQKYNMKATIFTIGVSVGKDTYKDSGVAINPHFSYEEAKEMIESGLVSVQSHTYDFHQSKELDTEPVRSTAAIFEGETQLEYSNAFAADLLESQQSIESGTNQKLTALAYPEGVYTILSQIECRKAGLLATFTTEPHTNVLVRGLSDCLYGMGRYGASELTDDELISLLEK